MLHAAKRHHGAVSWGVVDNMDVRKSYQTTGLWNILNTSLRSSQNTSLKSKVSVEKPQEAVFRLGHSSSPGRWLLRVKSRPILNKHFHLLLWSLSCIWEKTSHWQLENYDPKSPEKCCLFQKLQCETIKVSNLHVVLVLPICLNSCKGKEMPETSVIWPWLLSTQVPLSSSCFTTKIIPSTGLFA